MKPPKCKTCGTEEWKHTCGSLEHVIETDQIVMKRFLPAVSIAALVTKPEANVTVTKPAKGGRPKLYASGAERQRACRARRKAKP